MGISHRLPVTLFVYEENGKPEKVLRFRLNNRWGGGLLVGGEGEHVDAWTRRYYTKFRLGSQTKRRAKAKSG